MNISDVRIASSKAEGYTDKALIWLTALPAPLTFIAVALILVLAAYVGHLL